MNTWRADPLTSHASPRVLEAFNAGKNAAGAIARRYRWVIIVFPLLVVVLSAQQEQSFSDGRPQASRLENTPRQTGAIAGIHAVGQPSLVFDHVTDKHEPNTYRICL